MVGGKEFTYVDGMLPVGPHLSAVFRFLLP